MTPDTTSAQDILAQLNDIQPPENVSAWPLAWGWWVLIVITLALIVWAGWTAMKRYRRNKARREAIQLLESIDGREADWPSQMNAVLKRAALHYYPHEQVAALYGTRWQVFLQSTVKRQAHSRLQALTTLQQAQYAAVSADHSHVEECRQACLYWLKKARLPATANEVSHV